MSSIIPAKPTARTSTTVLPPRNSKNQKKYSVASNTTLVRKSDRCRTAALKGTSNDSTSKSKQTIDAVSTGVADWNVKEVWGSINFECPEVSETEWPFRIGERKFENGRVERGLFATRQIQKGSLVVWIPVGNVRHITKHDNIAKIESQLRKKKQPLDSIFHTPSMGEVCAVYDLFNVTNLSSTHSYWYSLNHSRSRANLKPCCLKSTLFPYNFQTIGFRALRSIGADEELLFDYQEPDPDWSD